MKLRFVIFILVTTVGMFISNASSALAVDKEGSSTGAKSTLKQIMPEFIYSYLDFDFNSTKGENYNRFQGYSNLYAIGADHIILDSTITSGVYLFKVDSSIGSQFFLSPSTENVSSQSIRNNTLFGHVRKFFTPQFDVDLSLGFGQNRVSSQTIFFPNARQIAGFTSHNTSNWFLGVNGFYKKTWNKLSLRTHLGLLYSSIYAGRYSLKLPSQPTSLAVASLRNEATYYFEDLELTSQLTPQFAPFVNGGLIQVGNFSNNRPFSAPLFNGSLPQLNIERNGYRVGAGLTYLYKQLTLRLEQKYYNAGSIYTSNQTILGVEYHFT